MQVREPQFVTSAPDLHFYVCVERCISSVRRSDEQCLTSSQPWSLAEWNIISIPVASFIADPLLMAILVCPKVHIDDRWFSGQYYVTITAFWSNFLGRISVSSLVSTAFNHCFYVHTLIEVT